MGDNHILLGHQSALQSELQPHPAVVPEPAAEFAPGLFPFHPGNMCALKNAHHTRVHAKDSCNKLHHLDFLVCNS